MTTDPSLYFLFLLIGLILMVIAVLGFVVIRTYLNHYKGPKAKPPIQIPRDQCMHLDWAPESRANGWRSTCVNCGLKATGSCQT